jgi:hypothetical protein
MREKGWIHPGLVISGERGERRRRLVVLALSAMKRRSIPSAR